VHDFYVCVCVCVCVCVEASGAAGEVPVEPDCLVFPAQPLMCDLISQYISLCSVLDYSLGKDNYLQSCIWVHPNHLVTYSLNSWRHNAIHLWTIFASFFLHLTGSWKCRSLFPRPSAWKWGRLSSPSRRVKWPNTAHTLTFSAVVRHPKHPDAKTTQRWFNWI